MTLWLNKNAVGFIIIVDRNSVIFNFGHKTDINDHPSLDTVSFSGIESTLFRISDSLPKSRSNLAGFS